jgi:Mg-chelatase subunit ChlD
MEGDKIVAARAAATAFVRAVNLPEGQVGVVTFSRVATVVSPLTGDRDALETAIAAITTSPGTRIDAGLEAAVAVLQGPTRRPDVDPVVVVMTDGIQEVEPARPLALADSLRAERVTLYAIGLGTDVDVAYLTTLAGGAQWLYLSPSAGELTSIYEQIARLIPCPPASFWGNR